MLAMRKRVVIGVAAVIAFGTVIYVLSRPRLRTVAYHKDQYREALRVTGTDHFVFTYCPQWVRTAWDDRRTKRLNHHQNALIKLGYLEERVFTISNGLAPEALDLDRFRARVLQLSQQFTNISRDLNQILDVTTNSITIFGPHEQMGEWEELIRAADMP